MPLAKRIVPCLDVDHGKVVKCINFLNPKCAGDPVEMAKRYSDDGADELVFLDITASSEKRDILRGVVEGVAKAISIPFTVGGGIRNVSDARLVLCSGADKVSVNTAAVENPKLITELADVFGRQCVVCAIDARRNRTASDGKIMVDTAEGKLWFEVVTYGGTKTNRNRRFSVGAAGGEAWGRRVSCDFDGSGRHKRRLRHRINPRNLRTRQRANHRKRRRRNTTTPLRSLHRGQSRRGVGSLNFPLQPVPSSSRERLPA